MGVQVVNDFSYRLAAIEQRPLPCLLSWRSRWGRISAQQSRTVGGLYFIGGHGLQRAWLECSDNGTTPTCVPTRKPVVLHTYMFQDETHGAQANITLKLGADLRREMRILGLDRILASPRAPRSVPGSPSDSIKWYGNRKRRRG